MAPRSSTPEGDDFVRRLRACDDRMRALAYSMLGSADHLDDVLHDAYLKAFRGYDRFRGESSFPTWLGAIVYRCCLDPLRARGRTRARTVAATATGDGAQRYDVADPARPEDAVDARIDVMAALRRLSPDHRAILVLVDLQGLRLADAADVLGLPLGTVASRLARARTALRAALGLPADQATTEGTATR